MSKQKGGTWENEITSSNKINHQEGKAILQGKVEGGGGVNDRKSINFHAID